MKLITFLITAFASVLLADEAPKPESHTTRQIEGWTVRVDDRLLNAPNDELGKRALLLLERRLADIRLVMAKERVEQLQRVVIQLDMTHGTLTSMQYHPNVGWLTSHGFAPELGKCVHIPVAQNFADPGHQHAQPWSVLHELAHSYHDQVLGFDNAKIKEAWKHYKESGHGDSVLHVNGKHMKHYALTDQMEFFAEMSECYFGTNDFFPFVNGELKVAEPEIHALLKEIWGPLNRSRDK